MDDCLHSETLTEKDAQMAILKAQCRTLYKNVEMCSWLEDIYGKRIKDTVDEIYMKTDQRDLKNWIEDLITMAQLEEDEFDKKK